jgi:Ca2+/H+ antiporter
VLLLVATTLTGVAAELLVGSIEHAAEAIGLSDLFIGAVVGRQNLGSIDQ